MQRKQKRAYLYRFYPSDGQRKILACTFGCVRFVYNWALHLRSEAHAQEQQRLKNMLKNHCLAKHISDVGWGEFIRQLEYKSAWYGRTLTKIDRWYPSSKTCSSCRHVLENLSLDHRFWTCPACGTVHDRDINASKNILAEGLSVDACGGRVRPARVRTRQASPIETGSPSS